MRPTSSASYPALTEPGSSGNGKLLTLCVVLGALSMGVVVVGRTVPLPATGPKTLVAQAPTQVAEPVATPAPTKAGPRVTAPKKPAPWKVVPKGDPREVDPQPASAPRESGPGAETPDETPAAMPKESPSEQPATPPGAADDEDLAPASAPPPGPAPATPGGVSDAPDVAPEAGSPLDKQPKPATATSPTSAPKTPAPEKLRPGEKVERFADGTVKARYMTDSKGQRSGSYVENHPNGKVALKASYKAGRLDGTLTEVDPSGKIVRRSAYRNGQLHGELVTQDLAGKITARETWFEGKLIYPKSLEAIERKLAEIASEPLAGPAGAAKLPEFEPFTANSQIRALRRLRAFRYLCDVPYDVTLSRPYGELCTAASMLLEILGRLDHTPEKPPGVPDSLYVPARQGLAEGNLHEHSARSGEALVVGGVDIWVWDSDRHNIKEVGHRRWSLNPRMKEVAWGTRGKFTVMYSHDSGRPDAHARDFVAYPSRGYFPISYLVKDSAWSCAFDNDRYRLQDDAKVEVCPVDDKLRKGEPVELREVTVENKIGFGEGYAMIFKPEVTIATGARYWVTIKGVTDRDGKPVTVEYLVEFCRG